MNYISVQAASLKEFVSSLNINAQEGYELVNWQHKIDRSQLTNEVLRVTYTGIMVKS